MVLCGVYDQLCNGLTYITATDNIGEIFFNVISPETTTIVNFKNQKKSITFPIH